MSSQVLTVEKPQIPGVASTPKRQRIFFYSLNQIRIWPAMLVFVTHVEMYKALTGHKFHLPIKPLVDCGHQGVSFFFVLSGFLITYLMISEQKIAGKLDIRKFYMRRILRVWPLYFLIVAIAFFLVPPLMGYNTPNSPLLPYYQKVLHNFTGSDLLCFIFMVPNAVLAQHHTVHTGAQCWTVGIEEQFYLMWPLLFFLFRRHPVAMMFGTIVAKFAVLAFVQTDFFKTWLSNLELCQSLYKGVSMFDIEGLALGGIAAYFLLTRPDSRIIRMLTHKYGLLIGLLPLLFIPLLPERQWLLHFGYGDFVLAVGYACVIVNLARFGEAPATVFGKVTNYLGTITYGVYMFNLLFICLMLHVLRYQHVSELQYNLILYGGSIFLTFLVSIVSYEYYESWFLKRKSKFSILKTGPG